MQISTHTAVRSKRSTPGDRNKDAPKDENKGFKNRNGPAKLMQKMKYEICIRKMIHTC